MGSSTQRSREAHPGKEQLRGFLRAEDDPGEGAAIRRHLVESGCLHCLQQLNGQVVSERAADAVSLGMALRQSAKPEERRERLGLVARRGERLVFLKSVEESVSPKLLQELLMRTPRARRQAVRFIPRYQLLGLSEHLTECARTEVFKDVGQALELGRLAVETSEALPPEVYGAREVATARARALGSLANALRVGGDLREADRSLRAASELLKSGHGAPSDRADFLSLQGSLRVSQTQYDEAVGVLEEAAAIHRQQGEREAEARVLVQLGKALGDGGAAEEAVGVLEQAEEILEGEERGTLMLLARQCRAAYLNGSGRTSEARELLERLRPEWSSRLSELSNTQRLLWLDARISWSEGDLAAAEEKFLQVQRGWEERDEAYDYALVSLELAALYLEQGRTDEVRRLAERMLPIFTAQDIHRPALAALVLVQRAVANDTATVAFLQDVLRYLQRARTNPELTYDPDS